MLSQARVVIVGGGAMGVSLLYHLTRHGWHDVVLLEKNELTAGSTWHAAGLCTHFAHHPTIMEMRAASVRLYRDELPAQTGLQTGFHPCGALRVTGSPQRMLEFHQVRGLGRFCGQEFEILDPHELSERYPLCQTAGLLGAIYEPHDGYVDPALATNAMAAAARQAGARIYRHTAVSAIERSAGGEWCVHAGGQQLRCEHLVNAAGTWCREIGAMLGLDLPVVPMLHQYLVTDTVPEIAARVARGEAELPMIRDPEESWYLRQERDGYILGPYERDARAWSIDGVPPDFGMELLPPELERIEHITMQAMQRVPALAAAGIKTVVHGPITFTPDGNPLIGPAFALPNAWLLTGSSMGVMEGGGAGAFLAAWMVDGAPPADALAIDARRFGGYADRDYRVARAVECFGMQFGVHYPYEERVAGRPARTTPLYARQADEGAVFGSVYGWERPNWYATPVRSTEPALTFARPGWFDAVRGECLAVRDAVGIADLSALSVFEITGASAADFIASLGANRGPRVGRIGLVHALTPAAGVAAEFCVTRLGPQRYWLTSAAAAQRHDEDLLRRHARHFETLQVHERTASTGILALAGPQAGALLASLSDAAFEASAFPWLSAAPIAVAGIDLLALRISYAGEAGWELHVAMERLAPLYAALREAGRGFGLRPFGAYALNAMRLEKGYRAWGMDLTTERTPLEAGLAHLVRTGDREFTGRAALLQRETDAPWRMRLLEVDCPSGYDPFYGHCLVQDERAVGIVTSGGFGHRCERALALAYLRPGYDPGRGLSMLLLDRVCPAQALQRVPYDPDDLRPRGL